MFQYIFSAPCCFFFWFDKYLNYIYLLFLFKLQNIFGISFTFHWSFDLSIAPLLFLFQNHVQTHVLILQGSIHYNRKYWQLVDYHDKFVIAVPNISDYIVFSCTCTLFYWKLMIWLLYNGHCFFLSIILLILFIPLFLQFIPSLLRVNCYEPIFMVPFQFYTF